MKKRSARTLLFFILALPLNAISQNKPFTYDQLFRGTYPENIFQRLPNILGWLDDKHYLQRNSSGILESIDVLSGKASKYTDAAPESNRPAHTSPEFINPTPSPDGRWIAYTKKDNNLYLLNAKSGEERPLTSDGSDSILNGYSSWIYFEEILGRPTKYKAFWWSPDSKYLGFMRFDDSKVPVFQIYVPNGQHGYFETRHYPQPGDRNPTVKIGIAGIQDSSVTWADFNSEADQYFGLPQWTEDAQLWVPWMNRDQDTLIQYAIDTDGTKKQVYLEHQDTWVSLKDTDRLTFLPEGQGFIVKSDKDGWENLYLYDRNFRLVNQITKGNYWGTSILKIDLKQKQVYITARKESTTRFDLYRVSFDGRSVKRL
ncbi:MAG TPA: DPP IV N-terminal domain-containing protein, partial [Flavitalea sp.]|nr:DPP IV N-terminal domain-containing protein [Flavitalea sp.]